MTKHAAFARYAWGVLGYNIAVVLWGAFVRASFSGDGCGKHWPLCKGEVIPPMPEIKTLIELTHRATSGLALIAVLALLIWAFRAFPKGHLVRLGSVLSMIGILSEALLGAGLVVFGLVGTNDSMVRAAVMAGHLINTFLLLGALTVTAWWASSPVTPRVIFKRKEIVWLSAALFGLLAVGASGAIAALGDTLFQERVSLNGQHVELSGNVLFLKKLRIWHPVIAVLTAFYLTSIAWKLDSSLQNQGQVIKGQWYAKIISGICILQLLAGAVNVLLMAPVWMQIMHLLIADLLWVVFTMFCATVLSFASAEKDDLAKIS
jgi:heme A synthase